MSKNKNVPNCVICGKIADHNYENGKLKVLVVPYELPMAFMKFHFPLCLDCYQIVNTEKIKERLHSIACTEAGLYWSNRMYGNEMFLSEHLNGTNSSKRK
jgi:hypothetical protein